MSMEYEKKPAVSFLQCLSVPDGRTLKVEVKSEPIEWPHNEDNDTASKTYTATISFKLDKKAVKRMNKYLKRSGFRRKKDYLKYKKWRRILIKNIMVIDRNRMKYSDPNFHKRMRQFWKYDKKINRLLKMTKREKV